MTSFRDDATNKSIPYSTSNMRLVPAIFFLFTATVTFTVVQLSRGLTAFDSFLAAAKENAIEAQSLATLWLAGAAASDDASKKDDRPLVAVVMGATSKRTNIKNYNETQIATVMLPSLLNTMEADKYQYNVFVGVDNDDEFWMNQTNRQQLEKQAEPLVQVFVRDYPKNASSNRIPFNEILLVAYEAGADYFVRINDDTEFISQNWTSAGANTLASYKPPNVGVVGPSCREQRRGLLAHDMVHRTHMEIFDKEYYPRVFDNWYLDDWISKVYGPTRTKELNEWVVKHHITYSGKNNKGSRTTRYKPMTSQGKFLAVEIQKGKTKITQWLKNHTQSSDNITISKQ